MNPYDCAELKLTRTIDGKRHNTYIKVNKEDDGTFTAKHWKEDLSYNRETIEDSINELLKMHFARIETAINSVSQLERAILFPRDFI